MSLELYRYYTRDEIFDAFRESELTGAEGWFLSSKRLVGLFTIGERSPDNHFCDGSSFHWHSKKNETVPKPIQDFKELNGGYLFVKSPIDDRFAYVAQIKHVGMYGGGSLGCEAAMDVNPRIPTELLHELGGLYLHPHGDSAMNRSVAALRAASSPDERFAALQTFVEFWRGPIEERHALSDADLAASSLPVPKLLRQLYAGRGTVMT